MVDVRELVEADAPTLFELLNDPPVAAHMSSPPPSVDAYRGFIAWSRAERAAGRGICFGIVPPGLNAAVGLIQLRAQEPSWFTAEWGFAIGAAFWGTGAFVDAASLVAGYAFDRIGVHRLEARVVVHNGRGNGALQKLGASPEGELASAFAQRTGYAPQFLWGLHVDTWRQRPMVREPFSIAAARASIAAATRETAEQLKATAPAEPGRKPPPLYPFFVTEE